MTDAAGRPEDEALLEVLRNAQDLGFLGPGPVEPQLDHARAHAAALCSAWTKREGTPNPIGHERPRRIADLGSGGGLPGLVLGAMWPDAEVLLVEAQRRRAAFLEWATTRLGIATTTSVVCERAEEVGRDPAFRSSYQGVTARSFSRPAVTAECAAPLLETGGVLVVSEPPTPPASGIRWPSEPLAELGLGSAHVVGERWHFAVLAQITPCGGRYPRRTGVPAKRPLF